MPTESAEYVCSVCGEVATAAASAECNWCDQRYHLNQRNDVEARDCGQVWIDEQYLALQFACNTCLADAEVGAAAPPPARTIEVQTTARARAARPRRYRRRA